MNKVFGVRIGEGPVMRVEVNILRMDEVEISVGLISHPESWRYESLPQELQENLENSGAFFFTRYTQGEESVIVLTVEENFPHFIVCFAVLHVGMLEVAPLYSPNAEIRAGRTYLCPQETA